MINLSSQRKGLIYTYCLPSLRFVFLAFCDMIKGLGRWFNNSFMVLKSLLRSFIAIGANFSDLRFLFSYFDYGVVAFNGSYYVSVKL